MKRLIPLALCALFICGIGFDMNALQAPSGRTKVKIKGDIKPSGNDSINSIKFKAKRGDPESMRLLGNWFYKGENGCEKNYDTAYIWWKAAADSNDMLAYGNLGLCYQFGHGAPQDSIMAIRMYEKSFAAGNPQLFEMRKKNATKSAFDAMLIGDCYRDGIGVEKNLGEAANYFTMAADKGSMDGALRAGFAYYNDNQPQNALNYFEKAGEMGSLSGLYCAGVMLQGAEGVPEDVERRSIYFLRAAEGGHDGAQYEAGLMYQNGDGVEKNLEQAYSWFAKSAANGNADGMWSLGKVLMNGEGCERNFEQALFWLGKAAYADNRDKDLQLLYLRLEKEGHPFANYLSGIKAMHVDKNFTEASKQFKVLEKANIHEGKVMQALLLADPSNPKGDAKKGFKEMEKLANVDPEAMYYLGQMYEKGWGTEVDMANALQWYLNSMDSDFWRAYDRLAHLYYEGVHVTQNRGLAGRVFQLMRGENTLTLSGARRLSEMCQSGEDMEQDVSLAEALQAYKGFDNPFDIVKILE